MSASHSDPFTNSPTAAPSSVQITSLNPDRDKSLDLAAVCGNRSLLAHRVHFRHSAKNGLSERRRREPAVAAQAIQKIALWRQHNGGVIIIFFFADLLLVKQKEQKNFGTHEDVFKESASSEKKNHLAGSQQFAGRFQREKKK